MCDSIDGKRPEQANPQTQRVGLWFSGLGRGVRVSAIGHLMFLGGDDNVLKLERDDGCTR